SCMGYEIAGGLGVKLAAPEREVYVLVGDGSYLMLSSELVTAVQARQKLTIVLVDNHGYKSIGGLSRSLGTNGVGTMYRHLSPASPAPPRSPPARPPRDSAVARRSSPSPAPPGTVPACLRSSRTTDWSSAPPPRPRTPRLRRLPARFGRVPRPSCPAPARRGR